MEKLLPVRLLPAFKDYLWGGTKLKESYNKKSDLDIVAESWELSCHKDGQSVIAEGEFCGKTLSEYIDINGFELLGTKAREFDYFPLLIKFIDAKNNLSIQVHPNDEYALSVEGEYGKTEMWYILEADEGAYLYYGFNRSITKDELEKRIRENTILEVLNKVSVKKGDVFFIESGTVHAICAGIVICEIQQNSNTTYRVYDYDRRDKEGNPRQLHIEKAIEVSNLEKAPEISEKAADGVLAECKYFTVKKLEVNGKASELLDKTSFASVIVVDGSGKMSIGRKSFELKKGDSLFVPAQEAELEFEGELEVIISRV
ncbi:MAG: class I mannose-6-phosphate isomerase [Clostridia bacterium]|nr:class I mannose-6-phosphate isomerase [Clostridia bacterium]